MVLCGIRHQSVCLLSCMCRQGFLSSCLIDFSESWYIASTHGVTNACCIIFRFDIKSLASSKFCHSAESPQLVSLKYFLKLCKIMTQFVLQTFRKSFNPPTGQRRKIGISGGLVNADISAKCYILIHATKHVGCIYNVGANIVQLHIWMRSYVLACLPHGVRSGVRQKSISAPRDVSTKINNMAAPIDRPHEPRPKRKCTQKGSFTYASATDPWESKHLYFIDVQVGTHFTLTSRTSMSPLTEVYRLGQNRW